LGGTAAGCDVEEPGTPPGDYLTEASSACGAEHLTVLMSGTRDKDEPFISALAIGEAGPPTASMTGAAASRTSVGSRIPTRGG
jgi:hypothetical protein